MGACLARLEVLSERNDKKRFPYGSYVDIEHHLLRLALVSEVNPRANIKYQISVEKPPENKPHKAVATSKEIEGGKKHKEEYWAAGTGYGHSRRPEWDMKAYIAAQKEKDKQIEAVLLKILMELKLLYKKHAPQLKPRTVAPPTPPSAECIDPVEDMYNIIEGSALIPFLEQYLKADSFLEICRHTSVYKLIVDIIKEIAMQPQLLPLLGTLSDQNQSIYEYLQVLEAKANILLQHICKAGNGSIPKPPIKEHKSGKKGKKDKDKKDKDKDKDKEAVAEAQVDLGAGGDPGPHGSDISDSSFSSGLLVAAKSAERTAEEKLARDFHVLFRDVSEAFNRLGLSPVKEAATPTETVTEAEVMDITLSTDEDFALETRYKKLLQDLLFTSHEIELEGLHVHRYYSEFKKSPNPSQSQVFRIAQELTSLSSSLPLELSSSIFVRSDDDKLVLMRALITGPEGTPYSGGCYQFDIFFPSTYPKTPPLVNLQTTGGGTVRFNPNLYNCGKVCLSLLGTWEGQQGERWNETTSTVLQVLVSIQSLILVPEPYYNEPGYEQEIGTEAGKKHSFEYNSDVRLNNIKYAMIGQLQNPSPGLEDVIKTHFFLKKDRLLEEVEGWLNQGPSNSKLERAVQNLRTELNKLQPPPNLANLTPAIPTPQQTPKL